MNDQNISVSQLSLILCAILHSSYNNLFKIYFDETTLYLAAFVEYQCVA